MKVLLGQRANPTKDAVFGAIGYDGQAHYFVKRARKGTTMLGGLYQRRKWNNKAEEPFFLEAIFTARWTPKGWSVKITAPRHQRQMDKRQAMTRILNRITDTRLNAVHFIEEERRREQRVGS